MCLAYTFGSWNDLELSLEDLLPQIIFPRIHVAKPDLLIKYIAVQSGLIKIRKQFYYIFCFKILVFMLLIFFFYCYYFCFYYVHTKNCINSITTNTRIKLRLGSLNLEVHKHIGVTIVLRVFEYPITALNAA